MVFNDQGHIEMEGRYVHMCDGKVKDILMKPGIYLEIHVLDKSNVTYFIPMNKWPLEMAQKNSYSCRLLLQDW